MIDDDVLTQRLFGGWLMQLGIDMVYANEGASGLETARKIIPDLILLDFHMQGMDGMETAKRLSEDPITKNIPLVLLTNEDLSPEDQNLINEVGIMEYIHKSIGQDDLRNHIAEILKIDKTDSATAK